MAVPSAPPPDDDAPAVEQTIDVGTWNRFTQSLAAAIQPPGSAADAGTVTVSLEAPAPIVSADAELWERTGRGPMRLLRRKRRLFPSPQAPTVTLAARPDQVVLTAPTRDDAGRVLLHDAATTALAALGWERRDDVMVRRLTDADAAAALATRILIEVFDVAHPADLSVHGVGVS
ncbi:TY-Chap domain-containing protein [Actinomyces sp. MRS3W]|uniref:TY-Chap domain-containing protein n=1 Tax=Actinomyces sp. MRS3W TaxID=2800796 RepID=UPI0028FD312F|nr:hypothetical protein [Actinomyces sp. MRS3W]MDU0349415.1 hypothetical protein [Actinomyces sp. MRS3W]